MNKLKEKKYIGSICCGMGGFDTGLAALGFETAWAVDIMPEAVKSFKANHPKSEVYCKDAHSIEDFNKLSKENITGIVFGPPCQGFSRANVKRSMDDKRNYVYLSTLRAIKQINPEFFIFENVVGLLDMNFDDGSSVFEKIKKDYETVGMGYKVTHQVIDCSTVGVPQANRLRLIMVGFRKDLNHTYKFDQLTHGIGKLPLVTLKDTIWNLKDVEQTGDYYTGHYDWKFLSRNRQKKWNEPSYTVEASARYAKIHPGFGKMKWIGTNQWEIEESCRRLSILESKLIQTFPEDYIVCGSMEKQYEQIGNAVPPKLASFIGEPILNYYNIKQQQKEVEWLLEKVKNNPSNSFYKGLLSWINQGKELTDKQRKYIFL
jgi:DNA (cytosine-5)-methyltransferase 1